MTRIKITNEQTGDFFFVNYNPEEYTLNKENNFATQAIPGLSAPILQFVNGNMRTLEMELFLDTWDSALAPKKDVRDLTTQLTDLMVIDSNLHAPPVLVVSWASLNFRCVLAKASQKFIMFDEDGTPVRAKVNVTFNEYFDAELEAAETNRQTADYSKLHVVVRGETLSRLAGDYYEDPTQWRPIAIANRLDDPRSIAVGQQLLIPALPYTDPDTGLLVN